MPTATLKYPEWRPDMATNVDALNTPDVNPYLSSCKGVRPREDFYELHPTPATAPSYAVPARVLGAFAATISSGGTLPYLKPVAGTSTGLYYDNSLAWTPITITSGLSDDVVSWRFAMTPDANSGAGGVLAASVPDSVYTSVLLSNSAMTSFTRVAGDDPPSAATVAVVGQFAVVGQWVTATDGRFSVRWSAIGDPNDWPIINTTDALSKQSGAQFFSEAYGFVTHIAPLTDLSALVFQQRAIHRMTYIGGDLAWQFDTLTTDFGAETLHGNITAGGWIYFINRIGIFRTNGQAIEPIGSGKVNRYFLANVDWTQSLLITATRDDVYSLVYFSYADIARASSLIDNLLVYSYVSSRFTYIDLAASSSNFEFMAPYGGGLLALGDPTVGIPFIPWGFDTAHKSRFFTNTTTYVGLLRTGEDNLNKGGIALLQGARPLCTDISTAPTIVFRSRMNLAATPTEVTATLSTRSGIHNARSTGRYHAITMTMPSASVSRIEGLEFDFEPAGML